MITRSLLVPLACAALGSLAACAADADRYPSFAIPSADDDRVSATLSVPEVSLADPADSVDPLPDDLGAQLAALAQRGDAAHAAFTGKANAARDLARAAQGASAASDRWMDAQIALADLTSHRSETRLALADVDQLAARAQIRAAGAAQADSIAATQARLANHVSAQTRILLALRAMVEP